MDTPLLGFGEYWDSEAQVIRSIKSLSQEEQEKLYERVIIEEQIEDIQDTIEDLRYKKMEYPEGTWNDLDKAIESLLSVVDTLESLLD